LQEARRKIVDQLGQVIVGQQQVIEELLISLFSRGHCLLEGVAGAGQDADDQHLGRTLNLSFSRIQFTPDLMPADITGTEIIEENRSTGARERRFLEGPVFSNIILADEINRTPPKTQAALLEAMQERQVTVGRVRHPLADPFFVLATQNPIEQEGTYPLPEAQQDRFMFKVFVNYPSFDEEFEVARRTTACSPTTSTGAQRPGHPRPAADGPRGAGDRPRDPLRLVAGAADAVGFSGRSGFCRGDGVLGRRSAGGAVLDPGRQGPRVAARPHPRFHRRHPGVGQTGAAAPLGGQFCGGERRGEFRRDRRRAAITPTKEDELTSDARFKKIFAS
jgi:MoxR-like ATPase